MTFSQSQPLTRIGPYTFTLPLEDHNGATRSHLDPEMQAEPLRPAVLHALCQALLYQIDPDPDREGIRRTPERFARMWEELTAGYTTDPVQLINGAVFNEGFTAPVVVKDIEYYSLCEHHLLPFFGRAHVAYIPNEKGQVIGLSKIPRIVDMFARRLQIQERLTHQIADFLEEILEPAGVAVVCEGLHLCSVMRGVKKAQASMITRIFRGVFETDQLVRTEFLDHLARTRFDR